MKSIIVVNFFISIDAKQDKTCPVLLIIVMLIYDYKGKGAEQWSTMRKNITKLLQSADM